MSIRRSCLLIACAVGAVSAGCSDPVDQAAKQRIFSPEAPPQAVASAAEKLPPQEVATDPRIARRVLGMSAAEATERLGPHRYTAEVSFEWMAKDRLVKLVENRTLLAGAGGVDGDFHATLQNSREQGLELVRVDGDVYARNRYGKFRHRARDRGIAERGREEIHGAVREFDRLFRNRLALDPVGTVTHEGRTVWRYEVKLGAEAETSADDSIPPVKFAKAGPDETTARRLRFFERRQPLSLTGEILVDAETSTVLKAQLDGKINAPDEKDGSVTLRLTLNSQVTEIGKSPKLAAPKDFLPDADKPQGIADALDQFGIPRAQDQEETAEPGTDEVPDDEG
ncbi:MAG: hypothetical protein WBV82_25145 [Myxococcaceae bacterium]